MVTIQLEVFMVAGTSIISNNLYSLNSLHSLKWDWPLLINKTQQQQQN
jgi:hypothetical protein